MGFWTHLFCQNHADLEYEMSYIRKQCIELSVAADKLRNDVRLLCDKSYFSKTFNKE